MNIVESVFGAVGQVLKYTFWTTVTVVGVVAITANQTKPSDTSFDAMVRKRYKQQFIDGVPNIVKDVASYVATATLDTEVNDVVLFKIGKLDTPVKAVYIGVFNNWWQVGGTRLVL